MNSWVENHECLTIKLFADTCDYCLLTNIGFQSTPLPNDKFQIANPLFESLPDNLRPYFEKVIQTLRDL